jgi:hypothetical protein
LDSAYTPVRLAETYQGATYDRQAELRADLNRLTAVARETGVAAQDWGYLALEEVARYREAMRAYRSALVAAGLLPELPQHAGYIWMPL